jgi:DNA-binding response OmpR family regulator
VRECAVPKILIVEREGYEVDTAVTRADGMDKIEEFGPDLLVLDVMMEEPDDGFVMAQDLRRRGRTLPIMMLTSVGTATGFDFAPDDEMVPVDDFQPKPVDPATFVAKIGKLLSVRR